MSNPYEIDIEVETSYMADHSEPEKDRYVFAYTITLVNRGSISAKLLTRRWIITDADNRIEEVEGEGVVVNVLVMKRNRSHPDNAGSQHLGVSPYMWHKNASHCVPRSASPTSPPRAIAWVHCPLWVNTGMGHYHA